MAQQKQRKRLILSNNKNISTHHFQPTQRLKPNFMIDGIRNLMYTKHNADKTKLRIFSFIPQRQRKQPNFMNDIVRIWYIPNNKTHTHTTRTAKTMASSWLLLVTQSLWSYIWDNEKSAVFIFKLCKKLASFVHLIHHQFGTLHRFPKIWTWFDVWFRTFHPFSHESATFG